jgi:hypothetical protein
MKEDVYQPGVCNIGPAEREKRKWAGIRGVLIAVGLTFLGYVWALPSLLKLLVFFPAIIGAVGLLQYYFKFCAYFGMSSIFNFHELGKKESVLDLKARELDRMQALKILGLSFLAASLYTLLTVLVF